MSWRCSGNTNGELVDNLVKNEIVKSSKIANVMKEVDRGLYTKSGSSYMDAPQSIGYGVTISAPHMVSIYFNGRIVLIVQTKIICRGYVVELIIT